MLDDVKDRKKVREGPPRKKRKRGRGADRERSQRNPSSSTSSSLSVSSSSPSIPSLGPDLSKPLPTFKDESFFISPAPSLAQRRDEEFLAVGQGSGAGKSLGQKLADAALDIVGGHEARAAADKRRTTTWDKKKKRWVILWWRFWRFRVSVSVKVGTVTVLIALGRFREGRESSLVLYILSFHSLSFYIICAFFRLFSITFFFFPRNNIYFTFNYLLDISSCIIRLSSSFSS